MIGDPSQKISRNFDVLDEEAGLAQRGTFIIDPDGVVQAAEINADGIGVTQARLLVKLKQLNMFVTTQAKFAQLNGKKAQKHLNQA